MTDAGPDRLRRLLGGADAAWLVERVRRRIAHGQPLTGTVSLNRPTPAQRRAVESLLGRPPGRGTSLTVSLDDVDRSLRRSGVHPDGLVAAVTQLVGPVVNLAQAQAATESAWHEARRPLAAAVAGRPELHTWFTDARTGALIRRLGNDPQTAAPLLADLARVIAALPARAVSLARFASDTTADAHALDHSRPLATLALSAIRAVWWEGDRADHAIHQTAAQRRRALWEAAGVFVDDLSSTVLVLNLPADPRSRLCRLTDPAWQLGEPLVLTLRQLAREDIRFTAREAFICENPTVVAAAADLLGADCPPLICVNGQPTTAALRLLDTLRHDGTALVYHGDFDWGGLRIANLLHTRLGWRPWRYDIQAFEAATAANREGQPLTGTPVEAAWDSALSAAIAKHGRRLEEELVLDQLLSDLKAWQSLQ